MSGLDIRALRAARPAEQAALLRAAVHASEAEIPSLTNQLLDYISKGSIAPPIVRVWLGVSRDPHAVGACIRQRHSSIARRMAMSYLQRHLRRESTFGRVWDAVGGAEGLADVMVQLSVADVRELCVALGHTATAGSKSPKASGVRLERQRRMTELFHLLKDDNKNPDTRPLHDMYDYINPACTAEETLKWVEETVPAKPERSLDNEQTLRKLYRIHQTAFEQRALESSFDSKDAKVDLQELRYLIENNAKFGIQLLGKFAESENLRGLSAESFLNDVAAPLVKRCGRHRSDGETHRHIGMLVNACFQKHSHLRRELSLDDWGDNGWQKLISNTVSAWNPSTTRPYEDEILGTLIRFVPRDSAKSTNLDVMLSEVRPSIRYRFLQLFFQYSSAYGFDIGPPSNRDGTMLAGVTLPSTVFNKLPIIQAVTLFERTLEANPNLSFLSFPTYDFDNSVLDALSTDNGKNPRPDVHILRAVLIQRAGLKNLRFLKVGLSKDPDAVLHHLRTIEVPRRRKAAEQGHQPDERAFWSSKAMFLCIALDDLDLYAETLQWARRYSKDPLTVKLLYGSEVVCKEEGLDMLCALPDKAARVENVRERIQKANKALMILLETATMALREPSFHRADWSNIMQLLPDVVMRRLERVSSFQTYTSMSDEQLFDTVLQPTLDFLLEAETCLLKPGHERLHEQKPAGLLGMVSSFDPPLKFDKALKRPMTKFLDGLARGRDSLWERHRVRVNPSVVTLDTPWPRGLPVQFLVPDRVELSFDIPYVYERVEAVIFCDAKIALSPAPLDEEVQAAVGIFIDGWGDALDLYIRGADEDATRAQRISRAWTYVTERLKMNGVSKSESCRIWRPAFTNAGLGQDAAERETVEARLAPDLPSIEDIEQPTEWNPDPMFDTDGLLSKDRRVKIMTCIDSMREFGYSGTRRWGRRWETEQPLSWLDGFTISGTSPSSFWTDLPSRGKLSDTAIDAYVASSVLSLNSKFGSEASLLLKPFPDEQEIRIPPIYLDQDFLERQKGLDKDVGKALRSFISYAPPRLITQLAASILERIQAEKDETRRDYITLVSIIKLLLQGDDPSAVGPLVQGFIIKNTEASAWHRGLLNTGTLTAFEPETVEELFISLSGAIIERLKRQAVFKSGPPTESSSAIRPLVKVTTVKMMANLLRDTRFVKPPVAVKILTELMQHATHLDIRLAVLDSLFCFMDDDKLKPDIVQTLRAHAVPLAASLNERRPETENDWVECKHNDQLPTVWHVTPAEGRYPPGLDLLLQRIKRETPEILELVYEALRISAEKNDRWMALFFQKHGFDFAENILPRIPAFPEALLRALEITEEPLIPRQELETIQKYVLFLLDPPKDVTDITKFIKKDATLADSNEGEHWLKLWDDVSALKMGGLWMVKCLGHFPDFGCDRETEPLNSESVESFVMEMAEVILRREELNTFSTLISYIHPRLKAPDSSRRGSIRVLERLIERLDHLRSPEWQADRNRQPCVLPDTFPLRLKLLMAPTGDEAWDPYPSFVERIIALLERIAKSGLPYDKKYREINRYIANNVVQRLHVAVLLGERGHLSSPDRPTLVDHLRVKIAAEMVSRVTQLDDLEALSAAKTRSMVKGWEESVVEEFRDAARTLLSGLSGRKNWLRNDEI